MSELERYVAYYRMPVVGDLFGGEQVEDQRREIASYLAHTGGELVGEFTEVLRPAFEGETSPAFDLGLTCCLDLNAKLICALTQSELATTEKEKAADANIELLLITETDRSNENPTGKAFDEPPNSL